MAEAPPFRVLYIDDDPGICRLVQRRLERAGYRVSVAGSGSEGVAMASRDTFDAIALDHYMPARDGLETLADLRALPGVPPVVFVTGAEEPRIAVAAMKEGAADYVIKDTSGAFMELLGTTIRHAIEQRALRRAAEASERKLHESHARLERLAAQQAILLREVNHRVANSLQLISSLIELQARRLPDQSAREILKRAAERVDAVSLVHRRLYTSNDVEFVEMDQYLAGLIDEFRRAFGPEEGERITLESEPVTLETDRAVSVGLIVNELVTNSLKYAYPRDKGGPVRVALHRLAGLAPSQAGALQLAVEDDGIGYPGAGTPAKGSGLGATIVAAMAETLRASLELDRTRAGTRFVLTIPA